MKIISKRHDVVFTECSHEFRLISDPSCGFTIACTPDGTPIPGPDPIYTIEFRQQQIDSHLTSPDYKYLGIVESQRFGREPAIGVCEVCGHHVILSSGWANTCDGCGHEYNGAGQQLAPRSQWGYETGETF